MIPPDEVLPCGCIIRCSIEDEVRTITVIPCRDTCIHYQTLIEMGTEMFRTIEYRVAP